MKKILIAACITTMLATRLVSCPTCVGTMTEQSAPFFSDECYATQNGKNNNLVAHNVISMPDIDNEDESSPITTDGESYAE